MVSMASSLHTLFPHMWPTSKIPALYRRMVICLGLFSCLWMGGGFRAEQFSFYDFHHTVDDSSFFSMVRQIAIAHGLPPALLTAIMHAESNFNLYAQSPRGAKGLMQINAVTAKHLVVKDIWDPKQNIEAGARYLKYLVELFDGNVLYALAAYNAGPSTVKRFGGIPPYRETRRYVQKVMSYYHGHQHVKQLQPTLVIN